MADDEATQAGTAKPFSSPSGGDFFFNGSGGGGGSDGSSVWAQIATRTCSFAGTELGAGAPDASHTLPACR